VNIAIFGWYHHRNAGDDRIQQCLTRWLDGHTLAFLPAGRRPPVHLLRTYDAAILGGGGIIQTQGGMFRDMARWVRAAGIPVALAGVSVERMTPELRDELRAFLDVCSFAWFRDRGSLEEVGEHPRAFVAPDATWLYPFAPAAEEGEGVAVTSADLAVPGIPVHPWPLYFENGGDAAAFNPAPEELDLEPARRAAAVLTRRFHGLLFAIQLGRPALVVSETPKVRRFLEDNGLQDWQLRGDLVSSWPAFVERWPRMRMEALRLRERLRDEVREKTAPARERLLSDAAALPPPGRRIRNRLREMLDLGSWI
jgi:polysaccharide pyruvyl transferase WcaK-like protein